MVSLQEQLKGFDELNQMQTAAMQAQSNDVLQFTQGSDLLALIQSNSTVAVFLESIAVYLYAFARASTSTGGALDTFIEQFSQSADDQFHRLPAVAANGSVTFSRYDTTQQAVIPVDSQVETTTGNIVFNVIKDTLNPNWNNSLNGYVIPVGTASINVPIQAVVKGASGNVTANQINQIVQGIPYVNNVTNSTAFINGVDEESDPAFLARFQLIINSLTKATPAAWAAAIESVQDGILYNILENTNYAMQQQLGFNTIIIDDGTGDPPGSLITAVENVLEITRALGVQFGVYATTPLTVNVVLTLLLDPTYDQTQIENAITTALTAYINTIDVGDTLFYFKVPEVIYKVSQGILSIESLTLNGTTADIVPTPIESVKVGTITINDDEED